MNLCPECGTQMVPMIMSEFCPKDCDRKSKSTTTSNNRFYVGDTVFARGGEYTVNRVVKNLDGEDTYDLTSRGVDIYNIKAFEIKLVSQPAKFSVGDKVEHKNYPSVAWTVTSVFKRAGETEHRYSLLDAKAKAMKLDAVPESYLVKATPIYIGVRVKCKQTGHTGKVVGTSTGYSGGKPASLATIQWDSGIKSTDKQSTLDVIDP